MLHIFSLYSNVRIEQFSTTSSLPKIAKLYQIFSQFWRIFVLYSHCSSYTGDEGHMISFFMGSNQSLNRSTLRNKKFKGINQNLPDSNNLKIGDKILVEKKHYNIDYKEGRHAIASGVVMKLEATTCTIFLQSLKKMIKVGYNKVRWDPANLPTGLCLSEHGNIVKK